MFDIKKNPSQVMILGTGAGIDLAPKQTSKTIYGLNDLIHIDRYGIKLDLLFIMDVLDEKPLIVSGINNLGDIVDRINKLRVPLVAPFKYEEIPLSEAFPLEECYKKLGYLYFSNTVAYMIAYALLKDVKEIDIYGVNQASSSEYFYEKASVEYWLGVASGRGVDVTINGNKSELLINKKRFGGNLLYGYNQTYNEVMKAREKFGEPIIKKLLMPSVPFSKKIR